MRTVLTQMAIGSDYAIDELAKVKKMLGVATVVHMTAKGIKRWSELVNADAFLWTLPEGHYQHVLVPVRTLCYVKDSNNKVTAYYVNNRRIHDPRTTLLLTTQ